MNFCGLLEYIFYMLEKWEKATPSERIQRQIELAVGQIHGVNSTRDEIELSIIMEIRNQKGELHHTSKDLLI